MLRAIDCTMMRGGTSKGLFFLKTDLPAGVADRDAVLLAALGSPDPRQIDGLAAPIHSPARSRSSVPRRDRTRMSIICFCR